MSDAAAFSRTGPPAATFSYSDRVEGMSGSSTSSITDSVFPPATEFKNPKEMVDSAAARREAVVRTASASAADRSDARAALLRAASFADRGANDRR